MTNLEKVIFDTNFLFNKKASSFFGNRSYLEQFSKVSEILIPDIVIGELEQKYKRLYENAKNKFLQTILDSFLSHDADVLDINLKINELKTRESIKFNILELTDFSVILKIKELALKKEPPFECKDDTDKGFKDSYIYFTILEYIEKSDDEYIFVCTGDYLLTQALQKHPNIKVIKNFDEFENQTTWYFKKPYFIDKLKEILPEEFDSIGDVMHNINNNWLVTAYTKDIDTYLIEVDFSTKEIIDHVRKGDFSDLITRLIASDNFGDTHLFTKQLIKFFNYISDGEIIKLFDALFKNYQIEGAFHHSVKEFYWKIYENKKSLFDEEMKNKIDKLFE